MNKFVLIFGVLITVAALVQAKPSPPEKMKAEVFIFPPEEVEDEEFINPPPMFPVVVVRCKTGEDCAAKKAKKAVIQEKNNLDTLNKWIDTMSPYGKANWRTKFPDTAKLYDKLQKSS